MQALRTMPSDRNPPGKSATPRIYPLTTSIHPGYLSSLNPRREQGPFSPAYTGGLPQRGRCFNPRREPGALEPGSVDGGVPSGIFVSIPDGNKGPCSLSVDVL